MRKALQVLLLFVFLPFFQTAIVRGGELQEGWRRDLDYEERMLIAELVRGLDNAYRLRQKTVRALVARTSGPSKELVYEHLIKGLRERNHQIREGVVETMVRIGDIRFLQPLSETLAFEPNSDARFVMISLFPAFLVRNDAARQQAIELLYRDNYQMTDRVRALLRARATNENTGGLDRTHARIRQAVVDSLTGQLDPVGYVLKAGERIQDRRFDAKQLVMKLCDDPVAGVPLEEVDAEIWKSLRHRARLRAPQFISTIQQRAAQLLGDIGALESWREIERLGKLGRETATESSLKALAELSTLAHERWAVQRVALQDASITEAEAAWRRREYADSVQTVRAGFELSRNVLQAGEQADRVRRAAYRCLGASRQQRATQILHAHGILREHESPMRIAVCDALGQVGGREAVGILSRMTVYKGYGATPTEREAEYRTVIAAINALGHIVARPDDSGGVVAVQELERLLVDDRTVSNLPTFSSQAVGALAKILGPLPDGQTWTQWHAQYVKKNKDHIRPTIPAAEVFQKTDSDSGAK